MKIVTWNVNGIRSCCRQMTMKKLLDSLDADVICLQETKITHDQMDYAIAAVDGYTGYFSFSKVKGGYSGVATFCKETYRPIRAEEGLTGYTTRNNDSVIGCYTEFPEICCEDLLALDSEGRAVLTEHELSNGRSLVIVNVYCPRADRDNEERYQFKMNFYTVLEGRCRTLLENNRHVVIVGDFNAVHSDIDHCEPEMDKEREYSPGRKWIRKFLTPLKSKTIDENVSKKNQSDDGNQAVTQKNNTNDDGYPAREFVDVFRYFHPNDKDAFTCWSTMTRARETNYGTRIDYIVGDMDLVANHASSSAIRPDVEGSDHCPVEASFNVVVVPSNNTPALCSAFLSGFSGSQQSIKQFVVKGAVQDESKNVIANGSSEVHPLSKKRKIETQKKSSTILTFFTSTRISNGKQSKDDVTRKQTEDAFEATASSIKSQPGNVSNWRKLLTGPEPPPLCTGHKEPCVLRTVKKDGPNKGKQFYCCARPDGRSSDKLARCNCFIWKSKKS